MERDAPVDDVTGSPLPHRSMPTTAWPRRGRSSRRQASDPEADDGGVPSFLGSHRARDSRSPLHRVEVDRIGYAFQPDRADAVMEKVSRSIVSATSSLTRTWPAISVFRDPRGEVDRATEVVASFEDHRSGLDPEVRGRQARVGDRLQEIDGRWHRVFGSTEVEHHAVAEPLDDLAAVSVGLSLDDRRQPDASSAAASSPRSSVNRV